MWVVEPAHSLPVSRNCNSGLAPSMLLISQSLPARAVQQSLVEDKISLKRSYKPLKIPLLRGSFTSSRITSPMISAIAVNILGSLSPRA